MAPGKAGASQVLLQVSDLTPLQAHVRPSRFLRGQVGVGAQDLLRDHTSVLMATRVLVMARPDKRAGDADTVDAVRALYEARIR